MATSPVTYDRRPDDAPGSRGTGFTSQRAAAWLFLYAVLIAYSSLILGPLGFHFVPQDPGLAWQHLLAAPFDDLSAKQRPDLIANLLMMVPFGLLAAASLARFPRLCRVAGALLLGFGFVLAIKYAQLFFPPRTVSLNYILAQTVGTTIGVLLYRPLRHIVPRWPAADQPAARLLLLLDAAILLFVAFALFPYDIPLSLGDLTHRLAGVHHTLLTPPGVRRPAAQRIVLAVATGLATVPLGMRLALARDRPAVARVAFRGAVVLLALFCVTLFVLSANLSLATLLLRLAGVVAGAALVRWLATADMERVRNGTARLVPLLAMLYLLLLAFANGLPTHGWRTPAQALAALDPRGLLPLWHDYIVSKMQATASAVVHVAMYAPVGVLLWLRRGATRRTPWAAAILAALLSAAVEVARWLKPGLQPDFNQVVIAGLAAALANRMMPVLWPMLRSLSRPAATACETDPASVPLPVVKSPAPWLPARVGLSLIFIGGAGAIAWNYPLGGGVAVACLAVFVAVLWLRPVLWMVLLPAIAPTLDLAPWTGWITITELDIAVLATLAVLLLRAPPEPEDLWPDARVRLFPRFVLALSLVACLVGFLRGISIEPLFPGGSDNPYLTWLNTLRIAKPYVCALALLPFLRARQRAHGDATLLFGIGVLIGLAGVGLAALTERAAFIGLPGIGDYRIVATFSSMHVGGGHIGVFLAFAMPFLLLCLLRARLWHLLALAALLALSCYTLVMTFARTAYAGTFLSVATASIAWVRAARRRRRRIMSPVGLLIAAVVLGALVIGLNSGFMRYRLSQLGADWAVREANWDSGLARRDAGPMALLFGMGTGSYPRYAALRSPPDQQPGNFVVRHGHRTYLATDFGPSFYFGQKVPARYGATYRLRFAMRAESPDAHLKVVLCAKLLLYSAECHALGFAPAQSAAWQQVEAELPAPARHNPVPAPIDLSFASGPGMHIDIADVGLIGPDGRDILANGDFHRGTDRWMFTSDIHKLWRIFDSTLAIWFEGGLLGTVALLLLITSALGGALRAAWRGDLLGAPVAGGILGVLFCGLFDNVFEAPRIAFLFYLAAMLGLMLGWPPRERRQVGINRRLSR
jgi:VanZ family protein